MTTPSQDAARIAEGIAMFFSRAQIERAFRELRDNPQNWTFDGSGELHCTTPYPMGFNSSFGGNHLNRLYWANGWGRSIALAPWERWLLRRGADAVRNYIQEQ
jgi:hypothetical protein